MKHTKGIETPIDELHSLVEGKEGAEIIALIYNNFLSKKGMEEVDSLRSEMGEDEMVSHIIDNLISEKDTQRAILWIKKNWEE